MGNNRMDSHKLCRQINKDFHEAIDALHWEMRIAPYRPGGHHGQRFWMKQKNTDKTQLLSSFLTVDERKKKLNSFGTQNRPSTHIINATICLEMWSITIRVEELSYILSYQA